MLGVPFDEHVVRFCTHWNIDDEDVDAAIEAVDRAATNDRMNPGE